MSSKPTALVIEDDNTALRNTVRMLEVFGFEVSSAASLEEAYSLGEQDWSLYVIDERLPDGDGADYAKGVRQQHAGAVIVISTVVDDPLLIRKAFDNGVNYFVVKPNLKKLLESRNSPERLLDTAAKEIINR